MSNQPEGTFRFVPALVMARLNEGSGSFEEIVGYVLERDVDAGTMELIGAFADLTGQLLDHMGVDPSAELERFALTIAQIEAEQG